MAAGLKTVFGHRRGFLAQLRTDNLNANYGSLCVKNAVGIPSLLIQWFLKIFRTGVAAEFRAGIRLVNVLKSSCNRHRVLVPDFYFQ